MFIEFPCHMRVRIVGYKYKLFVKLAPGRRNFWEHGSTEVSSNWNGG